MVDVIRPLLNEAVDLDHYKAASPARQRGPRCRQEGEEPEPGPRIGQAGSTKSKAIEKNFGRLQGLPRPAQENPKDGEAQLELGKYFGFPEKAWEKALPYFARSPMSNAIEKVAGRTWNGPRKLTGSSHLPTRWWALGEQAKGRCQARDSDAGDLLVRQGHAGPLGPQSQGAANASRWCRTAARRGNAVRHPVATQRRRVKQFDGHTDEVKGVACRRMADTSRRAARDQTVRIWDLTGKEQGSANPCRGTSRKSGRSRFIRTIVMLLSASWDTTVRMWDFKTGNEVKRWTHAKDVNGIALSRDASTHSDRLRRRKGTSVERHAPAKRFASTSGIPITFTRSPSRRMAAMSRRAASIKRCVFSI